jgi:hypothetical protein
MIKAPLSESQLDPSWILGRVPQRLRDMTRRPACPAMKITRVNTVSAGLGVPQQLDWAAL